jgi:diguanylate cyclase (GGDEF)-like protein/PAS domain S-box-containing protein
VLVAALAVAVAMVSVAAIDSTSGARAVVLTALIVGLVALVVLFRSLQLMRRRGRIEEARQAIESRTEARLRALVEHSSDVVTVLDPNLHVKWQAASVRRVLGHDPDSMIGHPLTRLVHPEDAGTVERSLTQSLDYLGSHTLSARISHASGGWRDVEAVVDNRLDDPDIGGLVLSMRDVTERKALEDQLRHQAFHDSLTGLANRPLFEDRLSHALTIATRRGRPFAVLFLDLDDFKTINDSLGHARGDELLRAAASRIRGTLRPSDTAARFGGDEFALLLEVADEEGARVVAQRVLDELERPFEIDGRELRVTASVGVALWAGSSGVDDMLRHADMAMYAAKAAGKASIRSFEPTMHHRVLERLELTSELRVAIEEHQFELDYQPIVELQTGRLFGVEALIRWQHPIRPRVVPEQFIGLAEETGLIVPIGRMILRQACAQARQWQLHRPSAPLMMSVNVSTRQLQEPEFVLNVREALAGSGLRPESLALEITESLLQSDQVGLINQLRTLKALGVRIAVDDFGTGYSSLSHLRHFPIDILKIDRSFADGIDRDESKAKLVRAIIQLGESLRLDVIAEGIELPEQAEELRTMHLPLAQGFLFAPPLRPAEIEALLVSGSPVSAGV